MFFEQSDFIDFLLKEIYNCKKVNNKGAINLKEYFMQSERIGFSKWSHEDFGLAKELWGDKDVTKYICATGIFTEEDIKERLNTEIKNGEEYSVQYWPIFEISSGDLIGCCGLRPFNINENSYEKHRKSEK